MSIKDILSTIAHTGADVSDPDHRNRVIKVNTIALLTGALALLFGIFFYIISAEEAIIIGTTLEGLAFFSVIYINKKRRYGLAALTAQVIPNLATLYFGIILSAVVEASLLSIFLIGTSFLLIKEKGYRFLCLGLTIVVLALLQLNDVFQVVKPLSFDYDNQQIIHYSAIAVVFSLNVLIIALYVHQNDLLLNALKERSEKLEKANDYKSIFVRETNHEIRVPLNAIYSISQLMLMDAEKRNDPEAIRPAEHLCAATHHALDIINNVLEFSRIEAGKLYDVHKAPFNVKSWVDNIVFTSQYSAGTKGVKIILDYNEREMPEQIVSDKLKLTQVVNNILFNAVKFTENNSHVVLSVTAEQDTCCIRIKDQGQGISKDRLASIFDPFITSRSNFSGGTGLGLHIAQHLITLLGGNITVDSIVGKGTQFSITFPMVAFKEEQDIAADLADNPEAISYIGMKMLVIEDDYMSQVHLTRYLSGLGSQTLAAPTGTAAIEILQTEVPDVIIMDRHLPDMEAADLLAAIRKMPAIRDIPVIITTGDVFETTKDNPGEDIAAYVIKPIDFKLLNLALDKCLKSTVFSLSPGKYDIH